MSRSDELGCLWWTSLTVVALVFSVGGWHSKLAYELYYRVGSSQLAIDNKPHDCDFWKAPIGEKECHYKRVVSTVEIGKDPTDNKPVMSLDGGKTWSYFTPDPGTVPQNLTVTGVSVTWEKVEED
jgi:hypothetical protein